ncbi:hypothetical protein O181_102936, partial [Austropuccinia psidii MF-1]|nr:hypothetical protein [Austropuccinia psidii MF-1]
TDIVLLINSKIIISFIVTSYRHQAVLTPTERAPLDRTPSFHQLSDNLERGPPMEGAAPCRRGGVKARSRLGEAEDEEGDSEEAEVASALAGAPEASEAPILAPSNHLLSLKLNQIFPKL